MLWAWAVEFWICDIAMAASNQTNWWCPKRLLPGTVAMASSTWVSCHSNCHENLGLILFHTFVGATDTGIKAPSTCSLTTLSCVAQSHAGGKRWIQRDLDTLERWICANLMEFNKAKCKILHLGRSKTRHSYGLGGEEIGNPGRLWVPHNPGSVEGQVG